MRRNHSASCRSHAVKTWCQPALGRVAGQPGTPTGSRTGSSAVLSRPTRNNPSRTPRYTSAL
jgi:hypothetical protein